jgi:hypothetical protein
MISKDTKEQVKTQQGKGSGCLVDWYIFSKTIGDFWGWME